MPRRCSDASVTGDVLVLFVLAVVDAVGATAFCVGVREHPQDEAALVVDAGPRTADRALPQEHSELMQHHSLPLLACGVPRGGEQVGEARRTPIVGAVHLPDRVREGRGQGVDGIGSHGLEVLLEPCSTTAETTPWASWATRSVKRVGSSAMPIASDRRGTGTP